MKKTTDPQFTIIWNEPVKPAGRPRIEVVLEPDGDAPSIYHGFKRWLKCVKRTHGMKTVSYRELPACVDAAGSVEADVGSVSKGASA